MIGGKPVLFYEIFIGNRTPAGLNKVEVLDGKRVLKTITGDELNSTLRAPVMGVNDWAVYMWVGLAEGDKPVSIAHKAYFKDGTLQSAPIDINYAAPIVISPPVYGENWVATEAPANLNHHRQAIIPSMGKTVVPERYAIDWVKYGPNGNVFAGNGTKNTDHYAYMEELHAVADGVIVDTKDEIPDNAPFNIPAPTVSWAAGNLVVELVGNSTYAFYAHVIPGTLRVKVGDKVKRGQVLGLLGNSGNSGAPHLHFHMADGKDALFSNAVPYVFESYTQVGQGDWMADYTANKSWVGRWATPVTVTNSMPAFGNVLDIPQPQVGSLTFRSAFEKGTRYETKNGKFAVLDLHGSFREMGRQYGYLMRNEMQEAYKKTAEETAALGMSKADLDENAEMFYQSLPERYVELMDGMAETSGLTLQQHKELNGGVVSLVNAYLVNTANAAGQNASKGCSGVAFWGKYSKDGKLYFGRDWDMVKSILVPYLPYLTVAVYHPDSGNAVANLQWAGEVYTETAMNDKGIFLELNNGQRSDPTRVASRAYAGVKLLDFMFDSSSMEDIDREFSTTLDSDSYIVQVANKDVAYSYEWPSFGVKRRSENVSGLLVAYNDFVPPYPAEWEGKVKAPNPRDLRRSNFLSMANSPEYYGKMDETLMQKFLAVPFSDGGGMIPNNVYQVIAVPEDYKMWLYGQNYSGWEEIDLKPLFFGNTVDTSPKQTGPAADEITISIVPEDKAKDALESGKLDYYLSPLAAQDVQKIKSSPNTNVALYPAISTFMGIDLNPAPAESGINPFASQKARFALNFLIDKTKIAQDVYGGDAFPVATIPWQGHPSYAPISSAVESFNITYDKAKGMRLLSEAMAEEGITMVNGKWAYNGTPLTLILPIYFTSSSTGARLTFANAIADDLRAAGFAVDVQKYDDYNLMPQYVTDPAKTKWNVDISGAVFYGASKYQEAYFLLPDSQEGWWAYNNPAINAAGEMMSKAATKAEWDSANREIARLSINDSVGIWLVALDSNYGVGKSVKGIVDDRFIGLSAYDTMRNANVPGKAALSVGTPYLYEEKTSWNPVVVENIYAMGLLNAMHDPAWNTDSKTLEVVPYRWGFDISRFSGQQPLPQGAFTWSVADKKWVETPANATATTLVKYDLSRYVGTNWHNGQKIGWADVLYFIASTSDRTYDAEKQKAASDQYKGTLDTVVGYRINGNTLEVYMNARSLDDSSLLSVARMFQRAAPFEIYAADDAMVFARKKYTYGDMAGSNMTPLNLVNESHVSDVLAEMGSLTEAQLAPMVTVNGVNYLENGELSARLKADREWNSSHGNLVISDGAFYLDYYNWTDGSARIKAFRDSSYPFADGAWRAK